MTKASERLFEVNYCVARSIEAHPCQLFWFSPTQVREHTLGYDTLVHHAIGIEIIQFKVPKKSLERPRTAGNKPCLRIEFPHHQVQALRKRASPCVTAHFVFPEMVEIGDYFGAGAPLLDRSWSLDASALAGLGPPGRQSNVHLGDFWPADSSAVLHSDPFEVEVSRRRQSFEELLSFDAPQRVDEFGAALADVESELPQSLVGAAFHPNFNPGEAMG